MNSMKYIGLDVHKETISIAVMNGTGKLVMESIIETKPSPLCSLCKGCVETCMSPSKKGLGPLGSMIC